MERMRKAHAIQLPYYNRQVARTFIKRNAGRTNKENDGELHEVAYLLLFIALIILFVLRSAYIRLSEVTAQRKAGIQPISVSCKMRQQIALRIFP